MEIIRDNTSKRFYRSRSKVFGGVCGGLAEYFGVDTALLRIVAAIMFISGLFSPFVFLTYVILWIAVPKEPAATSYGGNR